MSSQNIIVLCCFLLVDSLLIIASLLLLCGWMVRADSISVGYYYSTRCGLSGVAFKFLSFQKEKRQWTPCWRGLDFLN